MSIKNDQNEPPENVNYTMSIVIGIITIVGAVVILSACPLAIIWALNGLFKLEIPYDFFHWSCAAVLLIMLRADLSSPSKNE